MKIWNEDELVIGDCLCILGKLNGSSHWSNIEVWRRCAHNHGYWNELFQPSRRNTAGGKIATRVLASTASDGLTFNADILQQQHHIDKHFYLWNVILLAPLPLSPLAAFHTTYLSNKECMYVPHQPFGCLSHNLLIKLIKYSQFLPSINSYRHVLFQEILNSPYSSKAVNGVYKYPNTQSKNENQG